MNHEDLYNKSIDVIIKNQHLSGAYIACPSFPSYNYSWFRDSSYIAYSMDLIENFKSSEQFHSWAVNNINKRETEIRRLIMKKCFIPDINLMVMKELIPGKISNLMDLESGYGACMNMFSCPVEK
jgi:GH15 family glucan-1,4-alpha-glucosidase